MPTIIETQNMDSNSNTEVQLNSSPMSASDIPRLCSFCCDLDQFEGLLKFRRRRSYPNEGIVFDEHSRSLDELMQNSNCMVCSVIVSVLLPEFPEQQANSADWEKRVYLGPVIIVKP